MQFSSHQNETLFWEKTFSEVEEVIRFIIKSLGGDMKSRRIKRETKDYIQRQMICDFGVLDGIFSLILQAPFGNVDFDFSHHSLHYRFLERAKADYRRKIGLGDLTKYPNLKKILNLIYDCFEKFLWEDNSQSQIYLYRHFNIFISQLSSELKAAELLEKISSDNPLVISCLKPTHLDLIVEHLMYNSLESRMLDFLCSICSGITKE
jgi:hypothetical protein